MSLNLKPLRLEVDRNGTLIEVNGMEKLWIALPLLLFFVGCGNAGNTDALVSVVDFKDGIIERGVISREVIDGIPIVEVEWRNDVPWQEGDLFFTPDEDVLKVIHPIRTKAAAIDVAKAILEKRQEKGKCLDDALHFISYSSRTNLWCFVYALPDGSDFMDGDDWVIVVDGNKGSFVKAWAGE